MTTDQMFATLIDQANEVLGNIKNKEADASKNALATYHGTFAAHEDEIKAKSAQAQSDLEDAMNEVQDNLNSGKLPRGAERRRRTDHKAQRDPGLDGLDEQQFFRYNGYRGFLSSDRPSERS